MAKQQTARPRGRGLRMLSPELIAQAQDQTAATITRIMLTFVGVVLFCLLSLLTPDAALLTGGERLNVPFAGPVSFRGLLIIGPMLLIALWLYLLIYFQHWLRLKTCDRLPAPRALTVLPWRNFLLRGVAVFVLYPLLPLTVGVFTWKAAVLPAWGAVLLGITVIVIALVALALPLDWRRLWRRRQAALLSAGVAVLVLAAVLASTAPQGRSARLSRADLSNQWLPRSDLRGADLSYADLRGANLQDANLQGANLLAANLDGANLAFANLGFTSLFGAGLRGAVLTGAELRGAEPLGADLQSADLAAADLECAVLADANLRRAKLGNANLESADLSGANLEGAILAGANLRGAKLINATGLSQAQLDQACGGRDD